MTAAVFGHKIASGTINIVANEDAISSDTVYDLDPTKKTSVLVAKGGNSASIEATNSVQDPISSGDFVEVDAASTDDYFKGDNAGLTGVKVVTAAAVTVTIIQYP